jgi:Zn-dependent protease with chaperone function
MVDRGAPPPAAVAAARTARAGALLGALGLASAVFVVARLAETWRVAPGAAASHQISLLGLRLSYPTANLGAVVVLILALLGLTVTTSALVAAVHEVRVARRFARAVCACAPPALGDALIIVDDRPHAFCAGLLRPRVYVSSGAIARLDEPALQAVLDHERHHARRRDPLRLAAARVTARALFFVPGLPGLVRHQQALAELSADESAIMAAPENRAALARAILSFIDGSGLDDRSGVDPARVDQLLGDAPSWRFPLLLSLGAAGAIGLVVAVSVLAGQVAIGTATLEPPFVSSRPCILLLASIPALLAVGAAAGLRRRA